MSRIRIVLGGVAVVAAAAGVAVPALASTAAVKPQVEQVQQQAPNVQQAPPTELKPGEKWPGDPYVGKCVYWVKGGDKLQSCDR